MLAQAPRRTRLGIVAPFSERVRTQGRSLPAGTLTAGVQAHPWCSRGDSPMVQIPDSMTDDF